MEIHSGKTHLDQAKVRIPYYFLNKNIFFLFLNTGVPLFMMTSKLRHPSILILLFVFQSLYCYASPILSDELNYHHQPTHSSVKEAEETAMNDPEVSKARKSLLSFMNQSFKSFYLDILCALYGICNDNDQLENYDSDETKTKRLSSSLFHGIPKFGKRAFTSAFSGIPKFG